MKVVHNGKTGPKTDGTEPGRDRAMGTGRPRFFSMMLSGHDAGLRLFPEARLGDPKRGPVTPTNG